MPISSVSSAFAKRKSGDPDPIESVIEAMLVYVRGSLLPAVGRSLAGL